MRYWYEAFPLYHGKYCKVNLTSVSIVLRKKKKVGRIEIPYWFNYTRVVRHARQPANEYHNVMKKLLYILLTFVVLVVVGIAYMGHTNNVITPNIAPETKETTESAAKAIMESATSTDKEMINDADTSTTSEEI